MYGLDDNHIKMIQEIGKNNAKINKIILFGSWATGHEKPNSDIDLAIMGDLPQPEIWAIAGLLNDELPTPYSFDVVRYESLTNDNMKRNIDDFGKIIYSNDL